VKVGSNGKMQNNNKGSLTPTSDSFVLGFFGSLHHRVKSNKGDFSHPGPKLFLFLLYWPDQAQRERCHGEEVSGYSVE